MRCFYDELSEDKFKKITYTIYNRIYDDYYIKYLERLYGEIYSIDDFKYYDFELSDKEKFLLKMHNKDFLSNIKELKKRIENCDDMRLYVFYEEGIVRIVKLNKMKL